LITFLTAWNDGKIRVFTPETGKLKLIIHNAHSMGVTAIAATNDCKWIVSGGGEGQVCAVSVTHYKLTLEICAHVLD